MYHRNQRRDMKKDSKLSFLKDKFLRFGYQEWEYPYRDMRAAGYLITLQVMPVYSKDQGIGTHRKDSV